MYKFALSGFTLSLIIVRYNYFAMIDLKAITLGQAETYIHDIIFWGGVFVYIGRNPKLQCILREFSQSNYFGC